VKIVKPWLRSPASHSRRLSCQAISRRARAVLLWSLVALLVLQFGLAVAVDQWLPGVRDPEFAVRESRLVDHVRKTPDAPLLLVLGSSRTQLALQAGRLSATMESGVVVGGKVEHSKALVFNFGMPATGPLMQLTCVRRLLEKGIHPDRLFLEIMPPMLSWQRGDPLEEHMLESSRLSLREVARLWPYYEHPRRLIWKWWLAQCLGIHRRGAALKRELAIGLDSQDADCEAYDHLMDDCGWQPRIQAIDDERRGELTTMTYDQYAGAMTHFEVSPQISRALFELLAICRIEGIEVTLLLMPEGAPFRALYPPEADERLEQFLAELCREEHADLVDTRRWVDDVDFADGHHVLAHGAEVFTNRFQAEVLGPVLAKLHPELKDRRRFH